MFYSIAAIVCFTLSMLVCANVIHVDVQNVGAAVLILFGWVALSMGGRRKGR